MTKQEIYDKVCAHMAQQKRKSIAEMPYGDPGCAYRGDDGRRCNAGLLIADEHYTRKIEGKNLVDELVCGALVASGVPFKCLNLISALQAVHDQSKTAQDAREMLGEYARHYNITPGAEQAITEWQ